MSETTTGVVWVLELVARYVRLDVVTLTMLGLVAFIGVVIMRFSRTYMNGDAGHARYMRWLTATLGATSVLILSNHLVVLAVAWLATSLSLHKLLTYYQDRPRALIAAHKKFLISRLADMCLFVALILLGRHVGNLQIDAVHAWALQAQRLPFGVEMAAILFAIGAALKCAQIPFHGWLIQVMEAPTPVSALLHAGIVNMGGLLMIRLAPLMVKSEAAQMLLVVVGSTTAIVGALVMTTRSSIKVALAWSTCAQMGFMLVQCGLGAYDLALLHIVAHSLYKAHAFLTSGSTVEVWRNQSLASSVRPVSFQRWTSAAVVGFFGVGLVAICFGEFPLQQAHDLAPMLVLSLSVAALIARGLGRSWRHLVAVGCTSLVIATAYFTGHALLRHTYSLSPASELSPLRLGVVMIAFATLFVVQGWMQAHPGGRLTRTLYPRVLAGFYLDELFTRLTFRIWPPKLPVRNTAQRQLQVAQTLES